MKKTICLAGLLVCVLLSGCGGDGNGAHPSSPGAAAMSGAANTNVPIRAGDKITVRLSGVPDGEYYNEIVVPGSGDITLPLLAQPIHAAGLNTPELEVQITSAYKSQKLFTNPVVSVQAEERFVVIAGDVRGPTNIVWRPNLTLVTAINQCGGFTDYADRRHVRIIRGSQILHYDCIQAINTPGSDPAVFPEDQIYVPRTMF